MNNLYRPLAILFDWDGTLVDSSSSILQANNYVRRAFGIKEFTQDELIDVTRIGTARETFTVLYPDRVQEALDIYYGAVPTIRAESLKLMAGGEAFIQNLHAQKIPLGVVSNMGHGPLIDEIVRLGWDKYFQVVVGAGEAARGKPSPDPVYLAAERLGLARQDLENVWFFGDMETDEKAAKAAGCPFFYFTEGISDAKRRNAVKARVKFSDYGQLWQDLRPIFVAE